MNASLPGHRTLPHPMLSVLWLLTVLENGKNKVLVKDTTIDIFNRQRGRHNPGQVQVLEGSPQDRFPSSVDFTGNK